MLRVIEKGCSVSGVGYHLRTITCGEFGELSKVQEELEEAMDAEEQGVDIMVLLELSDLLGAIDGYLAKHYPDTNMEDLKRMSDVTQRAFRSGARAPKN
jgi:hypothetical protein